MLLPNHVPQTHESGYKSENIGLHEASAFSGPPKKFTKGAAWIVADMTTTSSTAPRILSLSIATIQYMMLCYIMLKLYCIIFCITLYTVLCKTLGSAANCLHDSERSSKIRWIAFLQRLPPLCGGFLLEIRFRASEF